MTETPPGIAMDGPTGPTDPTDPTVPTGPSGAEDRRSKPASSPRPDARRAGMGIAVVVLVVGAFATGWRFGRRWGRLMGW